MAGSGAGRIWSILLAVTFASLLVFAQDDTTNVVTSAHQDAPGWAAPNSLMLNLTVRSGPKVPSTFTVIPLTNSIGLNGTGTVRGSINITGELKAANTATYSSLSGSNIIAYLSCDSSSSNGFITPDKMLDKLMKTSPTLKAIVLYSIDKNICLINYDAKLPYTSILSIADSGDATSILSYVNATQTSSPVDGNISGSTGQKDSDSGSKDNGGNNSAVAMSILYSITGIITLLFLVIIATGAVRAHRYPERYGPRGGFGGRPRQSRAKGLARAVLDTIPIVKFGNQQPAKPDPELELDAAATLDGRDAPTEQGNIAVGVGPEPTEARTAAAAAEAIATTQKDGDRQSSKRDSHIEAADGAVEEHEENEAHLGCSICTEDFRVGEDVRVLPCNHQFHPHCVDPWLINVSGTCPLCRLDLRPGHNPHGESSEPAETIAPPLALEGEDMDHAHMHHGNRFTRLFDVNWLRHAPVEERIEALRQMRAQTQNQEAHSQDNTVTDQPHAAKLTHKLKDKFRILTRAQAAG